LVKRREEFRKTFDLIHVCEDEIDGEAHARTRHRFIKTRAQNLRLFVNIRRTHAKHSPGVDGKHETVERAQATMTLKGFQ
jgi:hypothetical protein